MSARRPLARLAAALPLALALAACGRGENQAAQTTPDSTVLNPVTDDQPANDSAYRAGQAAIDSAQQAGMTPADGIDSAAARGAAAASNDPRPDSARRTSTPGTTSGGATRPD